MSAEVDVRDLVGVVLLRVNSKQHLHAGQQVVFIEPDLGVLGVHAKQYQLRIVLALEPGGDERVPQTIDDCAVVVHVQAAADACEQAMVLGAEGGDGAAY